MKPHKSEGRGGSKMNSDQAVKEEKYAELIRKTGAVLGDERDPIVWMSTLACLTKTEFDFLWVGFYLAHGDELAIGPYQGSLGCLRIPFTHGVCGSCASSEETVVVHDVQRFPRHISCDHRSRSEIVVPVFDGSDGLRAVFDIDSSELGSFDHTDKRFLEEIAANMRSLLWSRIG